MSTISTESKEVAVALLFSVPETPMTRCSGIVDGRAGNMSGAGAAELLGQQIIWDGEVPDVCGRWP